METVSVKVWINPAVTGESTQTIDDVAFFATEGGVLVLYNTEHLPIKIYAPGYWRVAECLR